MNKFFVILALLIVQQIANTQDDLPFDQQIALYLEQLETDLAPRERISTHLKFVSEYNYGHPKADSLLETALQISKENEFPWFIARTLLKRATKRIYLNEESDLIFQDIGAIDSISQILDNQYLPTWVSRLKVLYYLQVEDTEKAEQYLHILREQLSNVEEANWGAYYTNQGELFQLQKKYKEAFEAYETALGNADPGTVYIYKNIAKLYLEMDQLSEAISYSELSIKIGQSKKNTFTRIESLIIRGEAELRLGDTLKAIDSWEEAEEIRSISYYNKNVTAVHKLVELRWNNKDQVDHLLSDIESYKDLTEYALLLVLKGRRAMELDQISTARKLCKEGLVKARRSRDLETGLKACDCLIPILQSENKWQEINEIQDEKFEFQAAFYDEKQIRELASNLAAFDSEKEKIALKISFEQEQELLNERIKRLWMGGTLGALLLLLVGYSWFQLRNKNRKIRQQNKTIQKSLKDKDLLLREIHHRVKNNLQLVSSLLTLQGRSLTNEEAQQAINDGKSRIRSMALIHQSLYKKEQLSEINVKDYLEKLSDELFTTFRVDSGRVKLLQNIEDVDMEIDQLVSIGLIVNELITNALKYAFPNNREGTLKLEFGIKDGVVDLLIQDDGVGYDQEILDETSFGTTLVNALTNQLDGSIVVNSNNGTSTRISFQLIK